MVFRFPDHARYGELFRFRREYDAKMKNSPVNQGGRPKTDYA